MSPVATGVIAARRLLAAIGAATRQQSAFTLQVAALFWGVLSEGVRPFTWRRTVRSAFRASLTNTIASSLATVTVTAVIVGVGLIFAPLYWLRDTGELTATGRIISLVLFRQIAPLLVGIILLGRSGIAMATGFGTLLAEGEAAILCAEGIDTFRYLVLPRVVAFAAAAFTLGIVFLLFAILSGYVAYSLTEVAQVSVIGFLGKALRAMSSVDLARVAAEFLMIGLLLALACSATGLGPVGRENPVSVLTRAFTRGVTTILVVTIVLSAIL